jgi:hypothetical protein
MKNISALFVILLLAPIAFSQTEVFEMIQKTEEGKEVFDNLFLETSLQGAHLNVNTVATRLNVLANSARKFRAKAKLAAAKNVKECRADLTVVRARFHDFNWRHSSVQRTLEHAVRNNKRRAVVVSRVTEELSHYRSFVAMNAGNNRAWRNFWTVTRTALRKAADLVARTRTHVEKLHRTKYNDNTFLEIPAEFKDAFAQITSEFNAETSNLNGLRPVIENLLELVALPPTRKQARRRLRNLLGRLAEELYDQSNLFAEENEHQHALFEGVDVLLKDSVHRAEQLHAGLVKKLRASAKRVVRLQATVKGSGLMSVLAGEVVSLRVKECRTARNTIRRLRRRASRFLSVIGQLQEVLVDRFGALSKYLKAVPSFKPVTPKKHKRSHSPKARARKVGDRSQ